MGWQFAENPEINLVFYELGSSSDCAARGKESCHWWQWGINKWKTQNRMCCPVCLKLSNYYTRIQHNMSNPNVGLPLFMLYLDVTVWFSNKCFMISKFCFRYSYYLDKNWSKGSVCICVLLMSGRENCMLYETCPTIWQWILYVNKQFGRTWWQLRCGFCIYPVWPDELITIAWKSLMYVEHYTQL